MSIYNNLNSILHFRKIILVLFNFFIVQYIYSEKYPLYPTDIVTINDGSVIIAEKGPKCINVYSSDGNNILRSIKLDHTPTGLAVYNDSLLIVTEFDNKSKIECFVLKTGKKLWDADGGIGACNPFFNNAKSNIYICNQFENTISEYEIETGEKLREVKVLREPKSAVFSKDDRYIFVNNFLPFQRADIDTVAACVSVIETKKFEKIKDIQLANGSNALRDICITPDGKFVYVSHNLGRFTVPTSQLQQGWMNTSAFSIIDTESKEYLASVLVDEPERGAAGIWSIDCNEKNIFISHSGTHEVSIIDHKAFIKKFNETINKSNLDYDLNFLFGIRKRFNLKGNGPRSMVLDSNKLIIPTYFGDILNFIDIENMELVSVNLNPDRNESVIDKGERLFNDATKCFQNWQSCNGCHPGDGRTDAMNWDLMNDGVGNPKNCKSLLFSHITAPSMISGIRENAELAVRAGFKHIQFYDISEEEAVYVDEYLKSLRPVVSPYLVNGNLSEKAKKGEKVFNKLNCGSCHSGPLFTDKKTYRIGSDIEFEKGWDTPTLIEVWRTAPYLFDGRAATMKDVFKIHKHGIDNKKVSDSDIEALTEYVNSL